MTCAKRQVRCTIFTRTGFPFIGTNACANPQEVCPREPGEGYEKCRSVCRQYGHAESEAVRRLWEAGYDAVGGSAFIEGHDHACDSCKGDLGAAGVAPEHVYFGREHL